MYWVINSQKAYWEKGCTLSLIKVSSWFVQKEKLNYYCKMHYAQNTITYKLGQPLHSDKFNSSN